MTEYLSRKDNFGNKEYLDEHLQKVSDLCGEYCSEFSDKQLGMFIGYVHDIGKRTERFQNVLSRKEQHINHAIIARLFLNGKYNNTEFLKGWKNILGIDEYTLRVISMLASCHHSELDIKEELNKTIPKQTEWDDFIGNCRYSVSSDKEFQELFSYFKKKIMSHNYNIRNIEKTNKLYDMLFIRMLFSSLVDADYSSSASFFNDDYIEDTTKTIDANKCFENLVNYKNTKLGKSKQTKMNDLRNQVFTECDNIGKTVNNKILTLTAPTGTGKTLAMLDFALQNAKTFNKKRIIVVLPFLSIISQTVDIYKDIFGENIVFEDDSQVENEKTSREIVNRWSAPVIITTTVKFFESLFSNNANSCRKLHNLCNSVILFDEFQSIPSDVLNSSMTAIKALTEQYNCTALLASASPPSLQYREGIEWWNFSTKEIIPDVNKVYSDYEDAKKLNVFWNQNTKYTIHELAKKIYQKNDTICIVNTKKNAENLYIDISKLNKDNKKLFLMSTNLCSSHRKNIIKEIKYCQEIHHPHIVISTQCIEAGVDISAENVIREIAPLYSIVQSAGRCNRNGEGIGNFEIINLDSESKPDEYYRNATQKTSILASDKNININNLKSLDEFYKMLYKTHGFEYDKKELTEAIKENDFIGVNDNYKIIDNKEQLRVIISYSHQKHLYDEILNECKNNNFIIDKKYIRKSQTISVSVTATSKLGKFIKQNCHPVFMKSKHGEPISTNTYILEEEQIGAKYDENIGIILSQDSFVI